MSFSTTDLCAFEQRFSYGPIRWSGPVPYSNERIVYSDDPSIRVRPFVFFAFFLDKAQFEAGSFLKITALAEEDAELIDWICTAYDNAV